MNQPIKQTELNAYLGVLKSTTSKNSLDILKQVAITPNTITATNLDTFVVLNLPTAGEGIYDASVLNLIKAGSVDDLSAYKSDRDTLDDFPEFHPLGDPLRTLNLNLKHARGTLGQIILKGLDFVSTDYTRVALTGVWAKNGQIWATNGYKGYMSDRHAELDGLDVGIPASTLKLYKKVAKYGEWRLTIYNDSAMFSNGRLTIYTKLVGATYPDLRSIAPLNQPYLITLPYEQIKPLITKNDYALTISKDGSLTLQNRPLPFRAEVQESLQTYANDEHRAILCQMAVDEQNQIALDASALKSYQTGKGDIKIRLNFNHSSPVMDICEPLA